jgi:hypothetical protein
LHTNILKRSLAIFTDKGFIVVVGGKVDPGVGDIGVLVGQSGAVDRSKTVNKII